MAKRQTVISQKKKRGPAPTGKGEPILVRLQPTQLQALDNWISAHPDPKPTRPAAIREGLKDWLISLGLLKAPEESELN